MNNVIVGLNSGKIIKIENVEFQELVKNINSFNGNQPVFLAFDDVIFVTENVEYIKAE